MKTTILATILAVISTVASAGGGKVNNPWQPVPIDDGEQCVMFLPEGIDLSDCIELASNTSGKTYFCETIETTVVCDPDAK